MRNINFRLGMEYLVVVVSVVTAAYWMSVLGVPVNRFGHVLLHPPLVFWSLSRFSRKYGRMKSVKSRVINILSKNQKNVVRSLSQSTKAF